MNPIAKAGSGLVEVNMSGLYIRLLIGSGHRIEHPDICPTGDVILVSFTLVGAKHQLRRFIAL